MKPGQRVTFLFWGKTKTGTIVEVGLGIVWRDDNGRTRWLHSESISPA